MPTTIQQASIFNVQATINTAYGTALAAITRPSWLASMPALVYVWPETGITPPAFSFTHIDVGATDSYGGRVVDAWGVQKGLPKEALLDVGCWVTRHANANWNAQLNTMKDMVYTVTSNTPQLVIKDYAANQSSPSDTVFLVRLGDIVTVGTVPDQDNPDIERVRILITYRWVYRSV